MPNAQPPESAGSQIQSVASPSQISAPPSPEPDQSEANPRSKPALKPSSATAPSIAASSDLPELECGPDSFVVAGLDPSFDASLTVMDTAYDDVESHCSMIDGDGVYYSYTIVGGGLTVADYQEMVDLGDVEVTSAGPSGFGYQRSDPEYRTLVEVWEADGLLVELAVIVDSDSATSAEEMIEYLLLFTADPASL